MLGSVERGKKIGKRLSEKNWRSAQVEQWSGEKKRVAPFSPPQPSTWLALLSNANVMPTVNVDA